MTAIEHEATMRVERNMRGRIRPTYGYYRAKNRWIMAAPFTPTDELTYRRLGWEPLSAYGRFDINTQYATEHALEWLFQQGGAKELPLEQIIEEGLYYNLPVVPGCGQPITERHNHMPDCFINQRQITFPQLAEVEVPGPFGCRFCGVLKNTEKARGQHERVAHKPDRNNIQLGETIAASMASAMRPASNTATKEPDLSVNPYVCGFCSEGFKNPIGLGKHVKDTHK